MAAIALLGLLACGAGDAFAQTYKVLHTFVGGSDGATPFAGLVRDSSGNLYGTTTYGGSSNDGTIYKIDTSGNETVIYSFAGAPDGAFPAAGLVMDSSGDLYGTTEGGGSVAPGYGTVFKFDTVHGTETVLYSFAAVPDAINPYGLMIDSGGNLYGTAPNGGASGFGAIFKLDTTEKETLVYSFKSGADGAAPTGNLVMDSSGNLYGTTSRGGIFGHGTIFKIDKTSTESVLYTFQGAPDGADPVAGLIIDPSGVLYGTTFEGGSSNYGTIFKFDGAETVLYNFTGPDGAYPQGGLVRDSSGNLYGTTELGGSSYVSTASPGYGAVVKLDTHGIETMVHNFTNSDGAAPVGLIMDPSGNLFGTAQDGGSGFSSAPGFGTVFKISFTVPFEIFNVRLFVTPIPQPGLVIGANLTEGAGAVAINPATQAFTLTVGPYAAAIPPGAFTQIGGGLWYYAGQTGGTTLLILVSQDENSYGVQVAAWGSGLSSLLAEWSANRAAPIPVSLSIGQNTGTVQVTANQ